MTVECNEGDAGATPEATRYQLDANESPSMGVINAVAATSGRDPTGVDGASDALDPLAEVIDPEALDQVFESRGTTREDAPVVEFRYCGHQVTVKGTQTVCVTAL